MRNNLLMTTALVVAGFALPANADTWYYTWSHPDIASYDTIEGNVNHTVEGGTFNIITGTAMRDTVNGDVNLTLDGVTQVSKVGPRDPSFNESNVYGSVFLPSTGGYLSTEDLGVVTPTDATQKAIQQWVEGNVNVNVSNSTIGDSVIGVNFYAANTEITKSGIKGKTTVTIDNSDVAKSVRGTNYRDIAKPEPKAIVGDVELNINNSLIREEIVTAGSHASAGNVVINVTGDSVIGYTTKEATTPTGDGWIIAGANRSGAHIASTEVNLNTAGAIKVATDVNAGSRERGDAYNTDVNGVLGDATLNILGGGNINVGRDIRAYHVAGNTTLNINNATVTVGRDVKEFKEINMDENAKLNIAGTLTMTSEDKVNMKLADTSHYSQITVGKLDANSANLKFTVSEEGTYNIVSATATTTDFIYDLDNTIYDITNDAGTLTVKKKDAAEVASNTGANANQAAGIEAIATSASTGNVVFDTVAENISEQLQSGDASQVKAALDTLTEISPEVAPMVQSLVTETTAQVFGAISTRLSGGAVASANQGMSSGDSLFEKGAMWIQTLYNHAKLDDTSKASGFKANTTGVAMGIEKVINDEIKAGLGYAYNDSEIKSHLRKTDVDTHTAFVYGEYKPSDWFVNTMMSYSWSDYDEKTATAKSKYDVDTAALQAMTGYNFFYGNTTITPEAGLRYIHIDQESHTNSVGAHIGSDTSDILTGIIGATIAQNVELNNGSVVKPHARLAFTYDIEHDDSNSFVALPNGSSYAVKGEALDRFGIETGAGLTAEINDEWEVSADYEYRFRDDYRDHTGMLNLKYKF